MSSAPSTRAGPSPASCAPSGSRTESNYVLGVAFAVVAVGFIAASDAFAKALAAGYDTTAIVLYRAVVGGSILGAAYFRARRADPAGPLVAAPWMQALRGVCVTGAAFLFFWGLSQTPLANAMALTATAPLFMALLAWISLGERPGYWLWPLLALGALGVGFIARPSASGGALLPYAAIVLSSALYAGVCVMTRAMAGRDRPETTAFASYLVMMLGAGAAGVATGVGLPEPHHLALVLGLGLSGALGMVVYAHAYAHAGVANLAPWDNVVFLWGLGFGAVIFGERPDAMALLGGGMIAASGFLAAMLRRG